MLSTKKKTPNMKMEKISFRAGYKAILRRLLSTAQHTEKYIFIHVNPIKFFKVTYQKLDENI